jgi:MFS transporter, putative metabolite:H+ symporter
MSGAQCSTSLAGPSSAPICLHQKPLSLIEIGAGGWPLPAIGPSVTHGFTPDSGSGTPRRVPEPFAASRNKAWLAVLAAALGYFVDAYDLVLYNIVRVRSLEALGIKGGALLDIGVDLLNAQLVGMLFGGILWGVWGDKLGRRSVLFGSILAYSLATLANGWVNSIAAYAICRCIAGVGLAGELGAGVTLVSELLPAKTRGYGTMIVAAVGVVGVCVASLVGDRLDWRHAYFVGGGLGLLLLGLRFGVSESGLFEAARQTAVARGSLLLLIRKPKRLLRYVCVVLTALPIWCAIGVLVTFSPELGKALGLAATPTAAHAVLAYYFGLTLGDLVTGYLSQKLCTRRRVIAMFMLLFGLAVVIYPIVGAWSKGAYYACISLLGFASGYWAVFITMSAELFGTNLRATVATTAPNFVRGLAVPLTLLFKAYSSAVGRLPMALGLTGLTLLVGGFALFALEESYGRSLDYFEN